MKFLILALAVTAQSALALPIVCDSYEKTGSLSTLRIRIGEKVRVRQNNRIWNLHKIDISPAADRNHKMYGTGSPRPESISMTIVKDGSVYGYVEAKSPEENGEFEGKVRIGGIVRGRVMEVKCFDEEIHGEVAP